LSFTVPDILYADVGGFVGVTQSNGLAIQGPAGVGVFDGSGF
jgi:hypothetical protein